MNRLAEKRKAEKLTRTELAARVGVSERHIFFLENGERTPSMKLAQRISSELHCPIEEIFLPSKCTFSTKS